MAKLAVVAAVVAAAALCVAAFMGGSGDRLVPNDPLYRYQISFHSPGGRQIIPTRAYRPSDVEYATVKGLDHNLERA